MRVRVCVCVCLSVYAFVCGRARSQQRACVRLNENISSDFISERVQSNRKAMMLSHLHFTT